MDETGVAFAMDVHGDEAIPANFLAGYEGIASWTDAHGKKFYDFALTPEAQSIGATAKAYQVPSNKNAATPPQAPKLAEIKLIDYDFVKYGSSAERKRLLGKWDNDVSKLPK